MPHPVRFPRVPPGLLLITLLVSAPIAVHAQDAPDKAPAAMAENSIVKVFSTIRAPDLTKPWTKQAAREVTGSGIVIEGQRILTNAHVVLYASQVQIQANQAGDKISATVETLAPGIDLAVLKLDDASFFDTHPALPRASALPQIKDPVLVYGFPTGGASLSITKGIVSRLEFASYNFPVFGLRVQIDTAINPGNSGGPALVGDKMIGLAFSHLTNTQNIGYIIPCEEIELFLKDIADGHYDGKPGIFDEFQSLENPALRAYLKLDKNVKGLVVRAPYSNDPAYPLRQWDVVTKIGDTPIDDQGMIKFGDYPPIRFTYLAQKIASGGTVPLTVLRGGKEIPVALPVEARYHKLIPFLQGAYPSYFIYGPLVFSPATEDDLALLTGNATNGASTSTVLSILGSPLVTRRGAKQAFDGEELVLIPSPFFPHRLAKGYVAPGTMIVRRVNGIPIKNLLHLVEVLRNATDEFIVIEFATRSAETMVFPRAEMVAATEEILTDNGVRTQGSPDALGVWNAKPAK